MANEKENVKSPQLSGGYPPYAQPLASGKLDERKQLLSEDIRVLAPVEFRLGRVHYPQVKEFLSILVKRISSSRACCIDFSETREISPYAAVVLLAHVDLARHANSDCELEWIESCVESVNEVLGSLRSASDGPPSTRVVGAPGDVSFRFYSDSRVDTKPLMNAVVEKIRGEWGDASDNWPGFTGSIVEVIENVPSHAYNSELYTDGCLRWWLAGVVDRRRSVVSILVYDAGIGIPSSLRAVSDAYDETDCELIERAVTDGGVTKFSGALSARRGNGLHTLREFVDGEAHTQVQILSGCAKVSYAHSFDNEDGPMRVTLPDDFLGTLIIWSKRLE